MDVIAGGAHLRGLRLLCGERLNVRVVDQRGTWVARGERDVSDGRCRSVADVGGR